MKFKKRGTLQILATFALVYISFFVLEYQSLNRGANLALQEILLSPESNRETPFVIISDIEQHDTPTVPMDIEAKLKLLIDNGAARIFWVLPDTPLDDQHRQLINHPRVQSIKIPQRRFASDGQQVYFQTSDWQPSAGFLISPYQNDGKAWTIPQGSGQFKSPVAALNPTLSDGNQALFIDYTRVSLNSAVVTPAMMAQPEILKPILNGKEVYIMPAFDLLQATIWTPYNTSAIGWHPIQFHAAALNAYENNLYKTEVTITFRAALIFSLMLVLASVYLVSPSSLKRISTYLVSAVILIASVPIAGLLGFVAPLLELFSSIIILLFTLEWRLSGYRHKALKNLREQVENEFRAASTRSESTKAFWQNIANMVSQNLQLQRSIFLELKSGDIRLTEISAINCNLADIHEMRRDIRREPYEQAVKDKQALVINRPFFKQKQDNEQEILVPFYKGTHVLGFWALTTFEQDQERLKILLEQVNQFAIHISTLLNLQQQSINQQRSGFISSARLASGENQSINFVAKGTSYLFEQLEYQRGLHSNLATPLVVFDIFGRINVENTAMQKLAEEHNFNRDNVNAYEFLKVLLPISDDSVKNLIRQTTLEQSRKRTRYFTTLGTGKYVVVVSSCQFDSSALFQPELHLNLNGLMVEIYDLKEVQAYLEVERGLHDHYMVHIKNRLSTLQMGLLQIERKANMPMINELATYLNIELKKAADLTRRTHYFMNRMSDRADSNAIPFNPLDILERQIEQCQAAQQGNSVWRDVTFISNLPSFATMGLGSPESFEQLLMHSFRLLADDAIAPKKIQITGKQVVKNDADILYLKIESEGYGLPNEQLEKMYQQNAIIGEQTLLSELLMSLKSAQDAGIDCRLKSRVGKGYRLSILIEGINLND